MTLDAELSPTHHAMDFDDSEPMWTFAVADNIKEKHGWTNRCMTQRELINLLVTHKEVETKGEAAVFVPGSLKASRRRNDEICTMGAFVYDSDWGCSFEAVQERVLSTGLLATISSTHSHMQDHSTVSLKDIRQHFGDDAITKERLKEMLGRKINPELLEGLKILDESYQATQGLACLVKHLPVPKWRICFPLAHSVSCGPQEWKEKYEAFGNSLKISWDRACSDLSHAYYLPSCKADAPRHAEALPGKLLDFNAIVVPRQSINVVEANDDLRCWIAKYGQTFEIQKALERRRPDVLRKPRAGEPGVHIECPFEQMHTEAGGYGTFVVNASENGGRGIGLHCCHNHCLSNQGNGQKIDRVAFLASMLAKRWLDQSDLEDTELGGGPVNVKRQQPNDQGDELYVMDWKGAGVNVVALYRNVVSKGMIDPEGMRGTCEEWPDKPGIDDLHRLIEEKRVTVNDLFACSRVLESQCDGDNYQLELIRIAKDTTFRGLHGFKADQEMQKLRSAFNVRQKTLERDLNAIVKQFNSLEFHNSFGVLSPSEAMLVKPLQDFKRRFGFINTGGQTLIIDKEEPDISKALTSEADFERNNRDTWYVRPDGKLGYPAKRFLKQPPEGTSFYKGGFVFDPSGNARADQFNLFKGMQIEPDPTGDCSLLKELLLDVWAQGNKETADWALEFLMHIIAYPAQKVGTSLAVRGVPGSGKSLVFESVMGPILGNCMLRVANQNLVLGNFNEVMCGKLLTVFEEAAFAGHIALFEQMKELITGATMTINPKHKQPFTIANYSRLVVISNNDHIVNISGDDRRYTVFETASCWKGTPKFGALLDQMEHGGLARFVYEAKNHNFQKLDNGRLKIQGNIKTEASIRQVAESRSPLQRALIKLLLTGTVPSEDGANREVWPYEEPLSLGSRELEQIVQKILKLLDPAAAKRATLNSVIEELHRLIGETKVSRPKGPQNIMTGKRPQLPSQRILPSRKDAVELARTRGMITQEEFESSMQA